MNKTESLINSLSDSDWLWWPLLFLRPAKSETFTLTLSLGLSALSTLLGNTAAIAFHFFSGNDVPIGFAIVLIVFLFVVSLLWFFLVKSCWNKRVSELRTGNS